MASGRGRHWKREHDKVKRQADILNIMIALLRDAIGIPPELLDEAFNKASELYDKNIGGA